MRKIGNTKIFRLIRWTFHWKRLLAFTGGSFVLFLLLNWAFPLPEQKSFSQVILANDGSLVTAHLTEDEKWRMRTKADEVPEELITALIEKEDQWFWYHPGVNPLAIIRAGFSNIFSGKRVSGASTITMQVARMMEPKPRTWGNKLIEVFRALQLEWTYSKTEILEMYLSYLPMGGNVEGVKAASYLYFDQPPAHLSLGQCALLTVVPNRPNSLRPDRKPEAASEARNKWLRRFAEAETFPAAHINDALKEPLLPERHAIPNAAPQFAYRTQLLEEGEFVKTTIDPEVQVMAQQRLYQQVQRHRNLGLRNGSVLIVDNHSMQVKAYCASADFGDQDAQGQCDAIKAPRSPGSTLKPLIYALAMDQGTLHPKSMLLDVPTEYVDFRPVNYDLQFRGRVPLDQSLQTSLNIPAVRVLKEVGPDRLLRTLRQSGFSHLVGSGEHYGLPLALGGCEASLEELVTLYAAFAHHGVVKPIQVLADEPKLRNRGSVCSPEAAWLVTEMLTGLHRPDLPNELLERTDLPKVAWKTGTSFGRRDAWAIGYNPDYTIGVWMGNMNGSAVLGMSGSTVAVPLLIDLFTELNRDPAVPEKYRQEWFEKPAGIENRKFCHLTGQAPGPHCSHFVEGPAIRLATQRIVCQHSLEVFVNPDSTIQYCKGCAPVAGCQKALYPDLPPDLSNWYAREGVRYIRPPVHNPACKAFYSGNGPKIKGVKESETRYLEAGQSMVVRTEERPDAGKVYWYINGEFSGVSEPGGSFPFEPPRGKVQLTCMDDKGRLDNKMIEVYDLDLALEGLDQGI